MITPEIKQLATGKNFGSLSVKLPNGQILNHIVWVDADDEHVLINTEVHRTKYRAMLAEPDVTVTILNSENPYSYAEVRGRVVGEVRGDVARAHIDALSQRYNGTEYRNEIESERVIMRIAPVRQRSR